MKNAEVVKELFDESEKFGTKMLGQAIVMSGGTFFKKLNGGEVDLYNMGVEYWNNLKESAIKIVKKKDEETERMHEEIKELKMMLETNRSLLADLTRGTARMHEHVLDEIESLKTAQKGEKKDKKAE